MFDAKDYFSSSYLEYFQTHEREREKKRETKQQKYSDKVDPIKTKKQKKKRETLILEFSNIYIYVCV